MRSFFTKKNKYFYLAIFIIFVFSCIIFIIEFTSAAGCACVMGGGLPPRPCFMDDSGCSVGTSGVGNCGSEFQGSCSGNCACQPNCGSCVEGQTQTPCPSSTSSIYCFEYSSGCWSWRESGCGITSCPADQCFGITNFKDWENSCASSCDDGSGLCLPCTCSPISTGICSFSKRCQTDTCSGSQIKCHSTNDGNWQWDLDPLPTDYETNCTDGYDNDCDNDVDFDDADCGASEPPLSPKLKFRQATTSNFAAVIGSNGVMDIAGNINMGENPITSTTNDFIIENNLGEIIALITYSGDLDLLLVR